MFERANLDIQVGPDSLDRALRIMNALLTALEDRDLRIEVTKPSVDRSRPAYTWQQSATLVHVGTEAVLLSLTESRKIVPRDLPPSPTQRGHRRDQSRAPSDPTKEYRWTGSLTIVVGSHDRYRVHCRRIRDGRGGRLEERLNDVVVELYCKAETQRRARLEREAEERHRREEEERRKAEERRRKIEAIWVHDVEERMKAWGFARDLREFVLAVESTRPPGESAWKGDQWIAWARQLADREESAALQDVARKVRVPPNHDHWSLGIGYGDPIPVPW